MGFYLRKSLRAGPFRFNLSKSGLGVSAGIPGFRIGTGPRGNYVHVGTHGVYYRASLGSRAGREPQAPPSAVPTAWRPVNAAPEVILEDVTGATATELLPSSADDLVTQLNQAAGRFAWWPWTLGALLVAALAAPPTVGVVLLIFGLPAVIWVGLRDRARRSVVAFYEVDGPQAVWFQGAVDAISALGQCARLWRIDAAGNVRTTHQYKVNAGASTLIRRSAVGVGMSGPKVLVTNIAVPSIASGRQSLHFLPDRLLVRDGRKFASISYGVLEQGATGTRFIETERLPRDAQQVDTTWKYVNVKGGPDRRFKNNQQLPVMLYGELTVASRDGLNWLIQSSAVAPAQRVAEVLGRAQAPKLVPAPDIAPPSEDGVVAADASLTKPEAPEAA